MPGPMQFGLGQMVPAKIEKARRFDASGSGALADFPG